MGIAGQPMQVRNPDGGRGRQGGTIPALRPSDRRLRGHRGLHSRRGGQPRLEDTCAVAHGVVEVWPLESTP